MGARPGCLITVEGVEGAGKSTQAARLGEWLASLGVAVRVTAEPDGTELGLRLRHLLAELDGLDPLAECLLFAAARAQHVRRVIRPALAGGITVISDRFGDSTLAYQGYGRGVDLEVIDTLNRLATDGLVPDLTLVLDLEVAEGLRRARGRPPRGVPDPFEGMDPAFHERVRAGYRALQARAPGRVVLVDASPPAETVAQAIRCEVARRLGLGEGA